MNFKIPYLSLGKVNTNQCIFLHGNGFPPESYHSLLDYLSKKINIYAMYQKPFSQTTIDPDKINNWEIFKNDLIRFSKENDLNNCIAIGHSMGAVLILLAEIQIPGLFKKIFLLDPVITSPFKSFFYKKLLQLRIIDKLHPMIKSTNRKKMYYSNRQEIYTSYRKKKIFSKIDNQNLEYYINSIIEDTGQKIKIKLSKKWENSIYRNGTIHDNKIWRNVKKINTPTYVITPEDKEFGHFNYGDQLKNKNNSFINLKIKNTTHLFPLEQPRKTSELILSNIKF